jgi:hypothetical protein
MKRIEYKYFVPVSRLEELRAKVFPFVEPDQNMETRSVKEYTVRSVYLDSPELDFYHEKIEGLQIRKKLRVRAYNREHPNSHAFLEIKRKTNQAISKDRAMMRYQDLNEFFETGDIERLVVGNEKRQHYEAPARKFLYHLHSQNLKPFTLVTYEREAFHGKFDPSFRLTFDKDLRFAPSSSVMNLFQDEDLLQAFPQKCIMEVKFYRGIPVWLTSLIGEFGLRREAISKYCIGVDRVYSHGGLKRMPRSSIHPAF